MAPTKTDMESILKSGQRRVGLRLAILLFFVLAALLAALGYWQSNLTQTLSDRYVTEQARISDIIVTVTATGTVEPTNKVEISSELSGTIRSVEVDDNDLVKRGQVIARLDTAKLDANLEHSSALVAARQARVAEAEANLAEVREAYERAVTLREREISSREQFLAAKTAFERAQAAVNSALAELRVAEADLKVAETNLAKACICSTIDGIVLERNVEVGQVVASSLQAPVLFTIAEDLKKMKLNVHVDEADIGKVAVGNKATFTVEAYQDRTFPAVILKMGYMPETVEGVVTYKATLLIDNEELLLRPGMTATAEINVEEIDDALVVPNAALRFVPPSTNETGTERGSGLLGMLFRGPPSSAPITQNQAGADGRRTLWVLRDDTSVPVEVISGSTDGSVTEILEGDLSVGENVITDMAAEQ